LSGNQQVPDPGQGLPQVVPPVRSVASASQSQRIGESGALAAVAVLTGPYRLAAAVRAKFRIAA